MLIFPLFHINAFCSHTHCQHHHQLFNTQKNLNCFECLKAREFNFTFSSPFFQKLSWGESFALSFLFKFRPLGPRQKSQQIWWKHHSVSQVERAFQWQTVLLQARYTCSVEILQVCNSTPRWRPLIWPTALQYLSSDSPIALKKGKFFGISTWTEGDI